MFLYYYFPSHVNTIQWFMSKPNQFLFFDPLNLFLHNYKLKPVRIRRYIIPGTYDKFAVVVAALLLH